MANRTSFQHVLPAVRWTPNATVLVHGTTALNCTISDSVHPRKEPWVIPLVVLCTVNITAILLFEAYVLYKSCGSRRHLFLGQVLLLGLFLSSLLGFAFIPEPNWFTCAITRAGVGIAYALVFATLLVKCVFLLSLHIGVYLSAAYQGLLLFFAVAVQLVIAVQWLVYRPATTVLLDPLTCHTACATPSSDTVASLAYVILLMVGVTLLAIRARDLPENHGEALYIGISIGLCIPLWVAWLITSSVSSRNHHDPCLAFGLALTASFIFTAVFLPKGRQLASMSRGGIYSDDGFSSVNQSIYTPSFLHLKPPLVPFLKQSTLVKPLTSTFPAHQNNFSELLGFHRPFNSSARTHSLASHHTSYVTLMERGYFVPPLQSASRLWRLSHHPATLQIAPPPPLHPSPEDIYLSSDRYLFGHPAVKLYRTPLY